MGKTDFCVFIGRFQPFHNGHLEIMKSALENEADKLVLVIGSHRTPRSLRNPWSYEERKEMIISAVPKKWLTKDRLIIRPARDYMYSNLTWLTGVQNVVSAAIPRGSSVKLIGHFKDDSSFYLKLFPQWTLVAEPNHFNASSTRIREDMFARGLNPYTTPTSVMKKLLAFTNTDRYRELAKEHKFLREYKKRWESAPYPPTFVTTDAVIVQAGHVLLVRRRVNPGKGKIALPGGFLHHSKSLLESCLKEVKEETNLVFPKEELKRCLKDVHSFDHPQRSMRGRTITHGHYFEITKLGPLPAVAGGDDAKEAMWVPLSDLTLMEEEFFEDHFHIINYFIYGEGR